MDGRLALSRQEEEDQLSILEPGRPLTPLKRKDHRHRDRAERLGAPATRDPESGCEVLVRAFGPALLERHRHHFTTSRLGAVPQPLSTTKALPRYSAGHSLAG